MTNVEQLGQEKYVSLTTYRKDGTPVATPLWVVRDGDSLVVWTISDSWKVKRLRRDSRVAVAPCDARGRRTGEPVAGRAEIMPVSEAGRVRRLIMRRYGLMGRAVVWGSLLRRGPRGSIGIRLFLSRSPIQHPGAEVL